MGVEIFCSERVCMGHGCQFVVHRGPEVAGFRVKSDGEGEKVTIGGESPFFVVSPGSDDLAIVVGVGSLQPSNRCGYSSGSNPHIPIHFGFRRCRTPFLPPSLTP